MPKATYVTVAAGSSDRKNTIVSFDLPRGRKEKSYELRDQAGRTLPVQSTVNGAKGLFVLPELRAGATKEYRLVELNARAAPRRAEGRGVELRRRENGLVIRTAGRDLLGYQTHGELPRADIKPIYRRGGYLYPVRTPSGRLVTDHYAPKHLHQQSIWFAWTKTEFENRRPDFWNMGNGTGTVEFVALGETWGGPLFGGFTARHRYVDLSAPSPKVVLNEEWEVTAYTVAAAAAAAVGREGAAAPPPYLMFDLVSRQECATPSPLVLPEYHYGGMGVRGHREWDGKENTFFLTSEGRDRSNGHGTRARWCHMGGQVDGQLAGIAILGHPGNFRAPQPMRIHPTEPFFNFAPSQLGRWEIAPGQIYVSRYRYIVADGPPDKAELDRLWRDYADPPRVTVTSR